MRVDYQISTNNQRQQNLKFAKIYGGVFRMDENLTGKSHHIDFQIQAACSTFVSSFYYNQFGYAC